MQPGSGDPTLSESRMKRSSDHRTSLTDYWKAIARSGRKVGHADIDVENLED